MRSFDNNQHRHRINGFVLFVLVFLIVSPTSIPDVDGGILQGDEAERHNAKGVEFYKVGRYEEAIASYKEALKLKKEYFEAYFNLGDAYFQLKQYKQAIDAYKHAIRYKPDLAAAFNNMATAYYKLGEPDKAIEAYKQSIQLNPKASGTYLNLGTIYIEKDNVKGALEQYQTLKTIDPQLAEKLYSLIYPPTATVLESGGMQRVRLNLSVTDAAGVPVDNLKQEDVQVFEDGVAQTISSFSNKTFPVIYGYAIDTSGSFVRELQQAIDIAKAVIRNQAVDDEALVVRFVDSYKIETVQNFTTDKELLNDALDSLFVEGGQSAILDAIYLSAQSVAQHRAANGTYLRRAIIVITDGDERGSYYDTEAVLKLLQRVDVQVFAIVLNKSVPKSESQRPRIRMTDVLKQLAEQTAGRVFFPKSTAELQALPNELAKILRTEYLVEYKSLKPVASAADYRRVTVSLADAPGGGKRIATTRSGYLIPRQ